MDKIPYPGAYAPSGIRTHDPLITSLEHELIHQYSHCVDEIKKETWNLNSFIMYFWHKCLLSIVVVMLKSILHVLFVARSETAQLCQVVRFSIGTHVEAIHWMWWHFFLSVYYFRPGWSNFLEEASLTSTQAKYGNSNFVKRRFTDDQEWADSWRSGNPWQRMASAAW